MCWPTSAGPAPATDRQRRSTAAPGTCAAPPSGSGNLTNYIARSLPGTGGFRPQLPPAFGYACAGGDARDQLRASDPVAAGVGETRQLTLNLNPGDNCFVVCGGAPCPAIVQAELVQERCRSARSKEVSPIFVHSRVLTPSRWSR
jgi:hypothetical protein